MRWSVKASSEQKEEEVMRKQEFLEGIRDGLPICLGYFSVSMAFGLTAVMSGVPIWAAVVISLTNLTSAGQFAGMNLIAAQGALIEIGLTTLIINMRYFLMSISVSQKVEQKMTLKKRMAVAFGITDEIFAVSMKRDHELTTAYMAGLIITPVLGWTSGTLVGAIATSFMPEALSNALGIALYGMFIAVIVPPAREQKNVLFAVVLAIAASVACRYLPVVQNLSSGWTIILITMVVCLVAAWLFPVEESEGA